MCAFPGRRSDGEDEKGPQEAGPDPSAPVTRRGVLTSFLTMKPMDIPEQDVVSFIISYYIRRNLDR